MASCERKNFIDYLNGKLRQLNTDETVFSSYIIGILEGDENTEEKTDALEGILSEIIDNDLKELVNEILSKWSECQPNSKDSKLNEKYIDVDEQLAKMLGKQKLQTNNVQRKYSQDELIIRQKILSQYSQTEVDEDDDNGSGDDVHKTNEIAPRNTNAQEVMQMQKERREQLKLECQRKKDKDKEDREKQKQLREEKKEKRKTVKGERRR